MLRHMLKHAVSHGRKINHQSICTGILCAFYIFHNFTCAAGYVHKIFYPLPCLLIGRLSRLSICPYPFFGLAVNRISKQLIVLYKIHTSQCSLIKYPCPLFRSQSCTRLDHIQQNRPVTYSGKLLNSFNPIPRSPEFADKLLRKLYI